MRGGWSRTSRPTSSPGTPSLQSAIWEDDVRALLIVVAIALGGCAAQRLNFSMYTRTDGRPVDAAKQQAALAQCKGEAVRAPLDPQGVDWGRKEKIIIDACMARSGYIQAQQ